MGLAASQTRFLSLTAKKSDLEYQAQTINTRRMQLAQKSADAAKAYTQGMSNKMIKIAHFDNNSSTDGVTTKEWMTLTYQNLIESGYRLIGANGQELVPSPYIEEELSQEQYNELSASEKSACSVRTEKDENGNDVIKYIKTTQNPEYTGMDIQSLLVSGQAQIANKAFYEFLVSHGYNTGSLMLDGKQVTYAELVDKWQSTGATSSTPTTIDWRSDTTSMFSQVNYTEDDAAVSAKYEATTAEIQAQDKILETEIKRIETEHKAIETEVESVKKVIDKNIETSYKSFA